MGERLAIDRIRCDGYGMCAEMFPEGIELDDWGYRSFARASSPMDFFLSLGEPSTCARSLRFVWSTRRPGRRRRQPIAQGMWKPHRGRDPGVTEPKGSRATICRSRAIATGLSRRAGGSMTAVVRG